jgi:hypothetical protein
LFLLDQYGRGEASRDPGPGGIVATALVFFLAWGIRASPWLQGIVLREGHSMNEIKSPLLLAQLVAGALTLGLLVSVAVRHID